MSTSNNFKHKLAVQAYTLIANTAKITRVELNAELRISNNTEKIGILTSVLRDLLSLDIIRKRLVPEKSTVEFWSSKLCPDAGEEIRAVADAVNWLSPVSGRIPVVRTVANPEVAVAVAVHSEVSITTSIELPATIERSVEETVTYSADNLILKFLMRSRGPHTYSQVRSSMPQVGATVLKLRLGYMWKSGKVRRVKCKSTTVMQYWHPHWQGELQSCFNEVYLERTLSVTNEGQGVYSLQRQNGYKVKMNLEELLAIQGFKDTPEEEIC